MLRCFLLLMFALPILSGCSLHADGVGVHSHGVSIEMEDGPRHCPPGHYKKGWC